MTSVEILGDRVPGCDGHHPYGGCLRCYLLPRIEKAILEERERCAKIAEDHTICGPDYMEHKDECHEQISRAIRGVI